MLMLRSLLFVALFYLWSAVLAFALLPLLVCPRRWMLGGFRFWAVGVIALLRRHLRRPGGGARRERIPTGRALIAPKHQCMFDVFAQFVLLRDGCS